MSKEAARTSTCDWHNRLPHCVYNGTTSDFVYAGDGLGYNSNVTTGTKTTTPDYVPDQFRFIWEVTAQHGGANAVSANYHIGSHGSEYKRDVAG